MRSFIAILTLLLAVLCVSCQLAEKQKRKSTDLRDPGKISVAIAGWVRHPGLYRFDSSATLETATHACGGWVTNSDVVQLRRIRLVRHSDGPGSASFYYVNKVELKTVQIRDGDELNYEAVHW